MDAAVSEGNATLIDIHRQVWLSIEEDATLVISTGEATMELSAAQVLALGDFLHATRGLWRP